MEGAVGQMAIVAAAIGSGLLLAWAAVTAIGSLTRTVRRDVNRVRGAERPEWVSGFWLCARCRSSNVVAAKRCATCRRPREELRHAAVAPRLDWIPDHIDASRGGIVSLVHDPAAHADPTEAHWKVTVGGQLVGSAARRDGALALLRSIAGVDTIAFDVRGTGAVVFRLSDVISRFESPPFPLDMPCPERAR